MSKKMFAIVGNWNFIPGPKGISVFRYDNEKGFLEMIDTMFPDVAAGQQFLDRKRSIVYIVDERDCRHGEKGGGGYIIAFHVDSETGKLTLINEKESLSPWPCYISLDNTKRYALVAHHGGSSHVTKIIHEKGVYSSGASFDDTALVLFRINSDGSLGEACDVAVARGEGLSGPHVFPHLHSVTADPSSRLFIVCDKGTDKLYTWGLDRDKGKLVPLGETPVETGSAPRYGAFHPSLPVFYVNFERETVLQAYSFDTVTGSLKLISGIPLLAESEENSDPKIEASDILIHPSGKYLYVAIRGINRIVILDIDEQGHPRVRGYTNCGGKHPRGLCLSPEGRFLFSANMESGIITAFTLTENGDLRKTGETKAPCPANMSIAFA